MYIYVSESYISRIDSVIGKNVILIFEIQGYYSLFDIILQFEKKEEEAMFQYYKRWSF